MMKRLTFIFCVSILFSCSGSGKSQRADKSDFNCTVAQFKRDPAAAQMCRQDCDANVGPACTALGHMHLRGHLVEQSRPEAMKYLQKGCKLGDSYGCESMNKAAECETTNSCDDVAKTKEEPKTETAPESKAEPNETAVNTIPDDVRVGGIRCSLPKGTPKNIGTNDFLAPLDRQKENLNACNVTKDTIINWKTVKGKVVYAAALNETPSIGCLTKLIMKTAGFPDGLCEARFTSKPIEEEPKAKRPEKPRFSMNVGKINADGLELQNLGCNLTQKNGLFAGVAIVGALSKEKSRIKKCRQKDVVRVNWVVENGKVVDVTTDTDDKPAKCIAKVVKRTKMLMDGTCSADIVPQ